jgi:HEAT repeat protein
LEDIYLNGVSEAEIEILVRWLHAENIQRVIEACIIIRRLGVEETLPHVTPLLNSHEFDVQRYAIDALSQIGDKSTLDLLKDFEDKASSTKPIKGILQEAIASIESVLSV